MEVRLGNKVYSTEWNAVVYRGSEKPLYLSKGSWELMALFGSKFGRIIPYVEFYTLEGVMGQDVVEVMREKVRQLERELGCSVAEHITEIEGSGWVFEAHPVSQLEVFLERVERLASQASALQASLKTELL